MHERDPRDVPLPGGQRGGGREAAQALEVEVRGGSRADERDARGRQPLRTGVRKSS